MHSMGKTVNELHAMLNLHEQTLPKSNAHALNAIRAGKVQKGNKHKKSHSQTVAKGHWERNCPQYLAELMKKKKNTAFGGGGSGFFVIELNTILNRSWIYDTGCDSYICNTTQGLRASRKLKSGALSLYVGNGQREAVEAIGAFYLCLPSGLEIVLNNCHYAPSITRGVISVSRLYEDEHPIPLAPVALEGQQVAPEIIAAHTAWIKGSKEIDGLMLMTMEPEIQRNLENLHAHEMLLELKTLYAQQAEQVFLQTMRVFYFCKQEEGQSVSSYVQKMKEFNGFVQNYNMHSLGKTINEFHAMLNLHEQTLLKSNAPALHAIRAGKVQKVNKHEKPQPKMAARGQNQGKGKNKLAYAPKPKIPPPPKREDLAKDSIFHECVLIFVIQHGLRASRKLKPGALSLYVGNGQREAVEAIGVFYLCLLSGLEIVLNNCHYAPSITRGVNSVSRLYKDSFFNCFVNNTIQVSRNNIVYFSAIPRDEIQQNLENLHAHEMLLELKTLYAQQAEQVFLQTTRVFYFCKQEEGQSVSSYVLKMKVYIDNLERLGNPVTLGLAVSLILIDLRKEFDSFVQNYNMHSLGKTINEFHAMLKLHEQTLLKNNAPALHAIRSGKVQKVNKHEKPQPKMAARGQNQGKEKNKLAYAPKPKIPLHPKRKISQRTQSFMSVVR
nr:hypothetical protein [Tanacetum cinerariifolium]